MRVRFWGTRGSIATPGPGTVRFGGNTACVGVTTSGGACFIFDCGTGARPFGAELMAHTPKPISATILLSHTHWDHIQGFPFFGPAFAPATELLLCGPIGEDGVSTLADVLRRQMAPPTFPVRLDQMPARMRFATIEAGQTLAIEGFTVRTARLRHPQGSIGFRIERAGRSLCFATDTEHPADGSVDDTLAALCHDVDVLVYDAQYTPSEYAGRDGGPSREGWGHSTYVAAARIARAVDARRLVLTHHDPAHDDSLIEAIERDARTLFPACRAAREQQPIQV